MGEEQGPTPTLWPETTFQHHQRLRLMVTLEGFCGLKRNLYVQTEVRREDQPGRSAGSPPSPVELLAHPGSNLFPQGLQRGQEVRGLLTQGVRRYHFEGSRGACEIPLCVGPDQPRLCREAVLAGTKVSLSLPFYLFHT